MVSFGLQFQLGVNAYGFIVTNNGFILVHPDLRSMVSFHNHPHNYFYTCTSKLVFI